MKNFIRKFVKDEQGVTALETAIILIAFVVVAAVFAFTILSTGTFLTERSKEAAFAGLSEVRGSMELRGSVVGIGETVVAPALPQQIDNVKFTLANVAGGQPVNLADGTDDDPVIQITYRDSTQEASLTDTTANLWTVTFLGNNNGDYILDPGELAEVDCDISGLDTALGTNTTFTIEVKPQQGAVLSIQRTTGNRIDPVVDLN